MPLLSITVVKNGLTLHASLVVRVSFNRFQPCRRAQIKHLHTVFDSKGLGA